jgi:hypothetical protein
MDGMSSGPRSSVVDPAHQCARVKQWGPAAEHNGVVGWATRRGDSGVGRARGNWPKKRFSIFSFYFVLNFFLNFQFQNLTSSLNFLL